MRGTRAFLLLLVFSISTRACAQGGFSSLSGPEKCWVIGHLFVAKKAKLLSKSVLFVCDSLKKQKVFNGNGNGDQLDAFRHSYWMALLGQHMAPRKAIKLGIAHEKGNYKAFKKGKTEEGSVPDSLSSVMDLANNSRGLEWGQKLKKENNPALIAFVIKEVKEGRAMTLLKNSDQDFLTCNYEVVDISLYTGKWSIPKCLVTSDHSE